MTPTIADAGPLRWIDDQQRDMCATVEAWAGIGSGTTNLAGLDRMADAAEAGMTRLIDTTKAVVEVERLTLPKYGVVLDSGEVELRRSGAALRLRRNAAADRSVLLCIHMDTVYGAEHPFRSVANHHGVRMGGPGVADAKGGMVVLLTALEALERSAVAGSLGWEVLITPDEEIGAPASLGLLKEAAARNDIGLLYEPSLPSGDLVGRRKGSGNFSVVVKGRAAHAGRAFDEGRNALVAMARLICDLDAINGTRAGLTLNVGRVVGGGAVNTVPDVAVMRFNVRHETAADADWVMQRVHACIRAVGQADGIEVELHGGFTAAPKPGGDGTERLQAAIDDCAHSLGIELGWQPSGGVCDGNRLANAGLVNIDTLGVRGGAIHSSDEYMLIESLAERAKLSALLLMRLASGELDWPVPPRGA